MEIGDCLRGGFLDWISDTDQSGGLAVNRNQHDRLALGTTGFSQQWQLTRIN